MITRQFTLYLENRPGELASVLGKIAKGGVNIEGISVAAGTDVALVQVVTSDVVKSRIILKKIKVAYKEQDVCVLLMRDEPGSISRVVSELAARNLNLNYIYATGSVCEQGGMSKVVISAKELHKVEALWKKVAGNKRK